MRQREVEKDRKWERAIERERDRERKRERKKGQTVSCPHAL